MSESDSINAKLFRDTIVQYITEESDPDKIDFLHRCVLLTVGDMEKRDAYRYAEALPAPSPSDTPNEEDDIPDALGTYLEEIAGSTSAEAKPASIGEERKAREPSNPGTKKTDKSAPAHEAKEVKTDTSPDADSPKPKVRKRRTTTGRDDDKVSPYAKEVENKTFVFPLKDKKQIAAELVKYGFTKEDLAFMKQYCAENNKRQSFQWAHLMKAAYTDDRTYGEITSIMAALDIYPPKVKYEGFTKYEERFKRYSTWLHWISFKREIERMRK